MVTTIQISNDLKSELEKRKLRSTESYENIIWDLIEDNLELSEETKKDIAISRRQIKEGKTISLESVKKKYNLSIHVSIC